MKYGNNIEVRKLFYYVIKSRFIVVQLQITRNRYLYIETPWKDYGRPKPLLNIVKNTMRSKQKERKSMCDIEK